jgi:hypothetical protein
MLCFTTLVTGIDTPVAAHIHNALAGRNGPILVTLTPSGQGSPGNSSGCVTKVDPELLNLIRQTPGPFYVNVHTVQFPDGALWSQLFLTDLSPSLSSLANNIARMTGPFM